MSGPVVLIIRDGWGENHDPAHDVFNAVKLAHTPVADRLRFRCPRTEILACGLEVGLPNGVMGNSEVGHQNIGAGRIVDQEIVRIDQSFADGSAAENPILNEGLRYLREKGGSLHLMGLVSDAGVHSSLSHLFALLSIVRCAGVHRVFVHAFTDGRDTPPKSGMGFVEEVERRCLKAGVGRIASVCGRFWAMDRDHRWERVQQAYQCLVGERAEASATSAAEAVAKYYDDPSHPSQEGDEFIRPTWILDASGKPCGPITDGDAVLFFNFRGDRTREITRALIDPDFNAFPRFRRQRLCFMTMTEYERGLCPRVLFPKRPRMDAILGEVASRSGIRQFRCAETEKYPHATYFFNDYREKPFPGENRQLIPSPKDVATYDLKPEMSAEGVCRAARDAILSEDYGLIVVNFANADMVGHTGSLEAAVKACATVDSCVGELLRSTDRVRGVAVVTADHGNADQMWNPVIGEPHTAHTLNPVEVVVAGGQVEGKRLRADGRLADLAPTVLQLLGLEQPEEMTGQSLLAAITIAEQS